MSDHPNDRLITRDPQAMERQLEDAEYAGSDTVEGLDSGLLEVRVGNTAGIGQNVLPVDPAAANNPNPGYTPPGQMVSPHPHEGAADLPEGAPAEDELGREGLDR
jgi:hypothetical protein